MASIQTTWAGGRPGIIRASATSFSTRVSSRTIAIQGISKPDASGKVKTPASVTPAQAMTAASITWGMNLAPPKFITSSRRPSTRSRPALDRDPTSPG